MSISEIATTGYLLASATYLLLAALLLTLWRARPKSPILALASLVSLVWAAVIAGSQMVSFDTSILVTVAELLRGIVWVTVFLLMLGTLSDIGGLRKAEPWIAVAIIAALLIAGLTFEVSGSPTLPSNALASGGLVLAILLVVLAEQVFRNVKTEPGSGLPYFCLSVAAIFLYDVLMHGRAILEGQQSMSLWAARGYINALLALQILYAVRKRFDLPVDTLVSRQIVFYSLGLAVTGSLLLMILAGNYYLRILGGDWSEVLRIIFAVSVVSGISILFVSPTVRARARVLMTKALFRYKYDYRREWLRFVATLSQSGPGEQVPVTAVKSIAQLVNSPGGAVWARSQSDEVFVPVGAWNCSLVSPDAVPQTSPIIRFLKETEWVVDIQEMREHPARYLGQTGEDIPERDKEWWLIVPMMLGERLSGFIMLLRPSVVPVLNFEDHDLLKTVGRHVATHIEQAETDRRLAEESQFGAYNRLTAFLMHDLKNLIAQQSLVVENAKKFGRNPDFVDDAIGTISHSVVRMRRLMEQLSSVSKSSPIMRVNLSRTINSAVKRASNRKPTPELVKCDFNIHVKADAERLSMVMEHLLRNAQEATDDGGDITISVDVCDGRADIAIADTGSGMTKEFIQARLFRPFDSTKGSQSMGIGVYQAREYVRSLGGHMSVSSNIDEGTIFTLSLPMATQNEL